MSACNRKSSYEGREVTSCVSLEKLTNFPSLKILHLDQGLCLRGKSGAKVGNTDIGEARDVT